MIMQIEGFYFNPLQVTLLIQVGSDVHLFLSDSCEAFRCFENWKVADFAAEINRCIKEFNQQQE